ncbi:MAG: hypothetical protein IJ569_03555 [Prevotella sp.]|nr:hypothetical protein [Prevotella sp.]
MWMMLQVIPIMWRAVRPSRIADMPAVVNSFWLPKGYEGLTFFGKILTPTQQEAERFNSGFSALKNHEMIHLRQAQSCGDSWLRFYLLYIWYWLKGLRMNRRMKNAAYLLNPFEMEAYRRMHDLDYLSRCEGGAEEWRRYAEMSLKERLQYYQNNYKQI